jgi:uncharacterized cupredoxin-like copper-binding protein
MLKNSTQSLALVLAAAFLLTMMGTAGAAGGHGGGHGHGGSDEGGGHGGGFAFGSPAKPSEADRTLRVAAKDQMSFSPERIQVQAGETVRFVVENVGSVQHSFTLATPAGQEAHEKEMQGMAREKLAGHMREEPNGIVVQPGETKTLAWRFAQGGPVQFACHIPGHFSAGMKGHIDVS